MITQLMNSIDYANDPKKRTKNPSTGKYDPTPQELAQRMKHKLNHIKNVNSQQSEKVGSTIMPFNSRQAQVKKKKKTRGNPFRVLMGKVGKLLDHGLEKKDIVRYLNKQKYWNGETIERAVDIVRDYNKKKKSKDDNSKSTSKKEVIKDVIEDTKNHKESSSNRNTKVAALDYDKAPDFTKKSTADLIMRVCYLLDVAEDNKSTIQVKDMDKNVDKKSAKSQLKEIRIALEKRGFDKDDLSNLGLGI
jgi:hypothetical protein